VRPTADAEHRYRKLFDRYHRKVYGYCRRRTDPDTAADCVAETFLVAWRDRRTHATAEPHEAHGSRLRRSVQVSLYLRLRSATT
jgi:DNA-directed RNA polymerase specialized sigma24 family protein